LQGRHADSFQSFVDLFPLILIHYYYSEKRPNLL